MEIYIYPLSMQTVLSEKSHYSKIMNLKKSLLVSTLVSATTLAAIVSLGHSTVSQASSTNFLETDMATQTLPAMPAKMPQTLSESPSEQLRKGIGKATYMLEDPAIEFTYEPNSFVLSEDGRSERVDLQINAISLWSKKDYLTIKNAGDELGDFPNKLRLATYNNPDGIPVVDWLVGSPGASLGIEVENLSRQADTSVAGRDAWTFSYRSLFDYKGVAFQDKNGQMIVITAYKPPVSSEATINNGLYSNALSAIVASMELTAAGAD